MRASAVRGLPISRTTVPTLLERIDDVEACVRAQLFHRLAEQPAAVEDFGPAALVHRIAGHTDRSSSVRSAAGLAVDAWHKHLGGILPLLSRYDIIGDEALGEAAAESLAGPGPSRECPWSWDTVWSNIVLICVLLRYFRNFSLLAVSLPGIWNYFHIDLERFCCRCLELFLH